MTPYLLIMFWVRAVYTNVKAVEGYAFTVEHQLEVFLNITRESKMKLRCPMNFRVNYKTEGNLNDLSRHG